ncbi:MAG: hypothetical protein AB7P04_15335, partial [Bacteriovoracia bacterium]
KNTDEGRAIFRAFELAEATNASHSGLEALAARIAARNPALGRYLAAQIAKVEDQLLQYRAQIPGREQVTLGEALVAEERAVLKFLSPRYLSFHPEVAIERLIQGAEAPVITEAAQAARAGTYIGRTTAYFKSPPLTSEVALREAADAILKQRPELLALNERTVQACSEETAIALRRAEATMAESGIVPPQASRLRKAVDELEETFGRMKECMKSQSAAESRRSTATTILKQIGINEAFLVSSYVSEHGFAEIPLNALGQDMAMNFIKPIVLGIARKQRPDDTLKVRYMRTLAFDAGFLPVDAVLFYFDPFSKLSPGAPEATLRDVGVREAVGATWTAGTFWKGPLFFDLIEGALCLWSRGSVRTKMIAQGTSIAVMAGEKYGFTRLYLYLRGHAMEKFGSPEEPKK